MFAHVEEELLDDHRSRLRLAADTEVMLARSLAGWAEYVVVEEPASLRAELRRLGAVLVAD